MKFSIKKNQNITAWYYDIGRRREFKITYKLPTKAEIKTFFERIKKRNENI